MFVAIADEAGQRWDLLTLCNASRVASAAVAQRWAGLSGSRGNHVAHLTLGYGDQLPDGLRSVPPLYFHVGVVDLVVSDSGRSEHIRLDRWRLQ